LYVHFTLASTEKRKKRKKRKEKRERKEKEQKIRLLKQRGKKMDLVVGLVVLVVILGVTWTYLNSTSSSSSLNKFKKRRKLGCFEYVLYYIVKSRGCHNIVLVCSFDQLFKVDVLKRALRLVYGRHDLLRASIVTNGSTPWYVVDDSKESDDRSIPLNVAEDFDEKLLEVESEARQAFIDDIISKEVNVGFSKDEPLVRLGLYQHQRTQRSEISITIRHDIMDGKSAALLVGEIFSEYTNIGSSSSDNNEAATTSASTSASAPLPPPIDSLLPRVPRLIIFVYHLFRWLSTMWFLLGNPKSMSVSSDRYVEKRKREAQRKTSTPSSSSASTRPIDEPLWETGVRRFELTEDETTLFMQRCKEHGVTVGCALYSAAMLTSGYIKVKERGSSTWGFTVWGIMIADMRAAAVARANLEAKALGNYVSTFDFVKRFTSKEVVEIQNQRQDNARNLWDLSSTIRSRLNSSMRTGYNLTSLLFAQYLTSYSNWYSATFTVPFPCPAFNISNLGSLDPPSSSTLISTPTLPTATNANLSTASLSAVSQAANFLPDLLKQLSKKVGLKAVNAAVSSSSSWPFPQMTSLTHCGRIKISLCYPKETVSEQSIEEYSNLMLNIIRDAIKKDS